METRIGFVGIVVSLFFAQRLIREMKKTNPHVEGNIFRSMENVALDTVRGWKTGGEAHSFLERFEKKEPSSQEEV